MKIRLLQLWIFLISILGLFYFGLSDIWVSLTIYIIMNVAVGNAMMHRYYGHKSFNMRPQLEKLSRWLCHHLPMGSVIGWAYYHRVHHNHSDTDDDPHSPTIQGIWHIIAGVWKYQCPGVRGNCHASHGGLYKCAPVWRPYACNRQAG